MTILARTIRGIRDSLPSGYIVGRLSSQEGPAELIDMKGLAQSLNATGALSASGSTSSPLQAMAFTWYFR